MRRAIATALAVLALAGCSNLAEPEPEYSPAVEQVETVSDPAETGMCMGRYIRVVVPEVPEGVSDPEGFLRTYYETYTRTYCEELTARNTLWA